MIEFKFVHEVCIMKLNKQRKINSTESLPPLLLKPSYEYVHVQCRGPKKGQQKF